MCSSPAQQWRCLRALRVQPFISGTHCKFFLDDEDNIRVQDFSRSQVINAVHANAAALVL
jgi:hypothetical protein